MAKVNSGGFRAVALSVLRIVVAALYMEHGLQLLFGLVGGKRVPLISFLGAGGIIILVVGLFFLLGLFTRIAAFILCGQMAVAFFKVHFPHGWEPMTNGGERAVLYCFVFLYFVFAGAGPISIDRAMGRS